MADSEFCERRRRVFATGMNNTFFVGSDIPDKRRHPICRIVKIIKRLPC